jgi:hypothetical protein
MDIDMETLSVNAGTHNNDSNTNTSTAASVREDTLAATSPSHPIARQTT